MTTGRPHPSRPAARQGGARHGRSQPPRRPPACLPRRALAERVRAALEGRLLRVVASVGHGKSTLLALATEELDAPVVWCADMGAGGRAPPRAVVPALASLIPGLRPDPILAAPPSRRVDLLCEEVERRAPRDVVVVLDDVVGPGARGAPTDLRRLVAGLPDSVHLALLARAELPGELGLPRPDAVDLDEAELALTPAEAEELLDLLAPEGDLAARDELVRTAEGWAAGLVIGARGGDPGRYLEAEVLAHEDEAAAGLLDEASPLERFTPDMAVEVTGRRDAAVTLAGLVRRHAFVTLESHGLDGDWHRMHPMMRALCGRRLERRSRADTARLHRRAAEAWLRLGRPEEAARHHLGAGDVAAALSALAPLGSPGADEQRRGVVAACLDAVPPELWSDTSGIVLVHASTLFYRADYVGAFEAMESAVELLLGQGEHERAAATLTRLLRAVPLAGGLHERGVATARRLIPRIRDSAAMLPAARVVLGLLLAELARYSEAERELSMVLIGDSGSGLSLDAVQAGVVRAFAIDHSLGRRAEAVAAIDEAIPVLAAAGADDRLHHLLYARGFRSIVLADGGRFEEALQEGERLRAAAAERGLARLASPVVAMLRFGPLAGLERWDVLESELVRAAPLFDRLAGTLRGYRYHVAAAQLAAARGDAEAVRTAVDGARAALAVHGHPYDTAMVQADLARAAFDTGLRELARTQADEARRQAEHARAPWAATRAAMVSAHVLGPGAGDSALADALARSRAPRMVTLWTERERSLALTLLPRALGAGLGPPGVATALAAACGGEVLAACAGSLDRAPPEVREALARAARRADDAEPALDRLVRDSDAGVRRAARDPRADHRDRPRPRIELATLGCFAVRRGERLLSDAEFGRKKSRMLLAFLACARRAVHREELAAMLWPDLPERRGIATLNSALHTLRRALEPDLSIGERSSLVVAEGPTYRLALGEDDRWDAEAFLRAARAAISVGTLDALLAAERAHTGVLLPEWTFGSWTEPLRTEIEEAHRAVCVRVAGVLAAQGRHDEAIGRYRILVATEPEREGWHRGLMRMYADAGERALALRQFETLRAILRERLGVEPSRETRELHTELLRDG